jgi:hypothetical protein
VINDQIPARVEITGVVDLLKSWVLLLTGGIVAAATRASFGVATIALRTAADRALPATR